MPDLPTFNPLDKRNLAESIVKALVRQEPSRLPPDRFEGAGIYLIYYRGNLPAYAPLAKVNHKHFVWPIYVGKGEPKGARKGADDLEFVAGTKLYERICEHSESIQTSPSTLAVDDFVCRWLCVDEVFIRLGERLLITRYKPVWNVVVEGFGNHPVGKGRNEGRRPPWDILHPGRAWADRLKSVGTQDDLLKKIKKHFAAHPPHHGEFD